MVATISRAELQQKLERGDKFTLVETLAPASYHHAHLPGAINLPPDKFEQLATLLPDKKADIVVYCASAT